MAIKMGELVKRSGLPKSTILFYIKEGLLPEPQKPKPNLHLYDDEMVERVQLITYLQRHFNASIAEIKTIMSSNAFNWGEGFTGIWKTLTILMGAGSVAIHSPLEVCRKYDIAIEKLNEYIENGLLFLRDGYLTDKELEILEILLMLEEFDCGAIIASYKDAAKELACKEIDTTRRLLETVTPQQQERVVKMLFDTTLILKPYLLNMKTLHAYQTQENKKDSK